MIPGNPCEATKSNIFTEAVGEENEHKIQHRIDTTKTQFLLAMNDEGECVLPLLMMQDCLFSLCVGHVIAVELHPFNDHFQALPVTRGYSISAVGPLFAYFIGWFVIFQGFWPAIL